MEPRSRLVALLILALTVFAPSGAWAQSAEDKKEARAKFDEAEKSYKLGRFQDALGLYTKAYELAPLPGLLFNIGQCHRELGNCEKAVFFFDGYLRDEAKPRNKAMVEELISECRAQIETKRADDQRSQEAERKRKEQEREAARRRDEEKARLLKEVKDQAQDEIDLMLQSAIEKEKQRMAREETSPKTTEAKPFYEKLWFWGVVGGTVAALVGGVVFTVVLENESDDPSGSLGTMDRR